MYNLKKFFLIGLVISITVPSIATTTLAQVKYEVTFETTPGGVCITVLGQGQQTSTPGETGTCVFYLSPGDYGWIAAKPDYKTKTGNVHVSGITKVIVQLDEHWVGSIINAELYMQSGPIPAGTIVTGYIDVYNIGESHSYADWYISDWPQNFGFDWAFDPNGGTDLSTSTYQESQVSYYAPDTIGWYYGTITVQNYHYLDNYIDLPIACHVKVILLQGINTTVSYITIGQPILHLPSS